MEEGKTRPAKKGKEARRQARRRGEEAEGIGAFWLQAQGWEVLEKNLRFRGGEIDILAREGETLVFVEIRLRKAASAEDAISSVGRRKQDRLLRAVQAFFAENPSLADRPVRLDILGIAQRPDGSLDLRLLREAFAE